MDDNASLRKKAVRDSEGGSTPNVTFDPQVPELETTWSSFARKIICVNAYPNGVTFSSHENTPGSSKEDSKRYTPEQFHLRFRDTKSYHLPAGKYFLHKEDYLEALENHLSLLRPLPDE